MSKTFKMVTVVGTSPTSPQEAIRQGIAESRHLPVVHVAHAPRVGGVERHGAEVGVSVDERRGGALGVETARLSFSGH